MDNCFLIFPLSFRLRWGKLKNIFVTVRHLKKKLSFSHIFNKWSKNSCKVSDTESNWWYNNKKKKNKKNGYFYSASPMCPKAHCWHYCTKLSQQTYKFGILITPWVVTFSGSCSGWWDILIFSRGAQTQTPLSSGYIFSSSLQSFSMPNQSSSPAGEQALPHYIHIREGFQGATHPRGYLKSTCLLSKRLTSTSLHRAAKSKLLSGPWTNKIQSSPKHMHENIHWSTICNTSILKTI